MTPAAMAKGSYDKTTQTMQGEQRKRQIRLSVSADGVDKFGTSLRTIISRRTRAIKRRISPASSGAPAHGHSDAPTIYFTCFETVAVASAAAVNKRDASPRAQATTTPSGACDCSAPRLCG
jgi:hypothetical protein